MATDSNARRDKALDTIARELAETNKLLKRIEQKLPKPSITFTPYLEEQSGGEQPSRPDPEPQPTGPYFREG